MSIGIKFDEEVKVEEGGFKDADVVCSAEYDDLEKVGDFEGIINLVKENCKGTTFLSNIFLNVAMALKG